jgi:biotin synthase
VNVLNPVAGTPMGDGSGSAVGGTPAADITTEGIVKTVAVYRLLHPEARVRLTGGREVNLAVDEQHRPFEAGADGILTGDYLTTSGQSPGDDIEVIERAGLEPNTETNEFDPERVKSRASEDADVETAVGSAGSNASDD